MKSQEGETHGTFGDVRGRQKGWREGEPASKRRRWRKGVRGGMGGRLASGGG